MGSHIRLALLAVAVLAAPGQAAASATAIRLFHNTFDSAYRSPGGAVPAGSRVTLKLRVTGAKASRVSLHVAVGSAKPKNYTMRRRGQLWSYALRTPTTPAVVNYDFRVRVGRRTLWYGDNGSDDLLRGGTGIATATEQVPFQITAYAPSFTTPAWLHGAVVYSIFPDRFRNGDPTNDYCRAGSTTGCPVFYGDTPADVHATWSEPVEDPNGPGGAFNRDFFGGDLQGVTQKLDYLKGLGVDAIWLNPIFMARSNHRYDTDNYMHVDPSLGGDSAFAVLVAAANTTGIRIILDGVFNHASSDSVYFDRYHRYATDGACESTSSPWRSWFKISGGTPCTSSDYDGWNGNDTLPVFQHDNAAVKDFFFRGPDAVAKHWLALGAAGWRLDAAQEIDHSWWQEFRAAVKAAAPDAPLIAEDTAGPADATSFLLGNEFDGVMNYRFRVDDAGFVRTTSDQGITALTPSRLDHSLAAMREEYPPQASSDSFNLIDSHDTARALNLFVEPGDHGLVEARERQRLAALLQFTYIGAPMILYGDEAGINAPGADPFNRAPYPWTDVSGDPGLYGPPDQTMLDYYTRLGRLRAQLPALKDGSFSTLLTGDTSGASGDSDVYAFVRAGGADKPVIVVLNKGSASESGTVPVRGTYPNGATLVDALGGSSATVDGGAVSVSVPARGGLVLVGR